MSSYANSIKDYIRRYKKEVVAADEEEGLIDPHELAA